MLLRRVMEHVRSQNWFAVVLDFVIVVFGIFIALQVDAWRISENERDLERQYLERLLRDMEVSILEQRSLFDMDAAGIRAMDQLAENLRARSLDETDRESTVAALNHVGWVERPILNLVTIRELQSSGNIALIRNAAIRDALGQLEIANSYALYSAEQSSALFGSNYDVFMRTAFLQVSEADSATWGYEMQPDYQYMLSVEGLDNLVSSYSGWFKFHRTTLYKLHDGTIALRDLVKEELETRQW